MTVPNAAEKAPFDTTCTPSLDFNVSMLDMEFANEINNVLQSVCVLE